MGAGDGIAGEGEGGEPVAGHLAGEGLAGLGQIAVDEAVDEADALGLIGRYRAAGHDDVECARLADEAR